MGHVFAELYDGGEEEGAFGEPLVEGLGARPPGGDGEG